jgi:hypothetical protein
MLKTLAAVPALSEALLAQSAHAQSPTKVDVLIVGSGPVGATVARVLVEGDPTKKILMVDLGAQLTALPGTNAKHMYLYNYGEDGLDTLYQLVKGELTVTSRTNNQPWPELLGPISQPEYHRSNIGSTEVILNRKTGKTYRRRRLHSMLAAWALIGHVVLHARNLLREYPSSTEVNGTA